MLIPLSEEEIKTIIGWYGAVVGEWWGISDLSEDEVIVGKLEGYLKKKAEPSTIQGVIDAINKETPSRKYKVKILPPGPLAAKKRRITRKE